MAPLRSVSVIAVASVLALAGLARAQTSSSPSGSTDSSAGTATPSAATPNPSMPGANPATPPPAANPAPAPAPAPVATPPAAAAPTSSDELHRDVQTEVQREMQKAKADLENQVGYVEAAEDARSYDAKELQDLKQTVNLLQLHGYFRSRANLFDQADLGRGPDASNHFLFPRTTGPNGPTWLGAADMRLRLNPVLRVSDDIALYGQFDVLDNAIFGGNPLAEPFFDPTTSAQLLSSRIRGEPVSVKRLWAEIETPLGQLAFGRKGFQWGEGMLYNDGNCLDCDDGTTFDRVQLALGPFLHHLVTVAVDSLANGASTADSDFYSLYQHPGEPADLSELDDAWRFSLALTHMTPDDQRRAKLDDGEWVLDYGVLAA